MQPQLHTSFGTQRCNGQPASRGVVALHAKLGYGMVQPPVEGRQRTGATLSPHPNTFELVKETIQEARPSSQLSGTLILPHHEHRQRRDNAQERRNRK